MSKSLKINYLYNLANTVSSMIFPLITFPYAARIMMADGIGQVNFFSSIISYISLFTCLGIPLYAVREIAKLRDDIKKLVQTTTEILLLHLCLTFLGYVVVFILAFCVDKVSVDIPLFLLLSTSLLFNVLGCEWFYQGIEDFKYITIRAITVRCIFVILLFLLVHSKEDIYLYAFCSVVGTVGNNLYNFIRLRKHVDFHIVQFKQLDIKRHIHPTVKIFALNIVISIYVNLDTVMLGFLGTNYAVGYYTGATKLTKILLGIASSLQTAMIPRCSYLVNSDSLDDFYKVVQKVVDFVVAVTIPISIILAMTAPSIIIIFCGPSYMPAIVTLEILSPIIFLISMSGIPCFQILYPLGKENIAIMSTATGALVNFTLNLLLIPLYLDKGAAIATLIAETMVTITMFLYGRKYIRIKRYNTHYFNCVLGGLLMIIVLYLLRSLSLSHWIYIWLMPLTGVILYICVMYLRKDSLYIYSKYLIMVNLNSIFFCNENNIKMKK